MTDELPITIKVDSNLLSKFCKLKSISNKLEAQFNFHTLAANWYGDEDNILLIQLLVATPLIFSQRQAEMQQLEHGDVQISHFSDDVICAFNDVEQQLLCHIAITDSELDLLESQPKILAGFLHAKLNKVLNLIAKQQSLPSI